MPLESGFPPPPVDLPSLEQTLHGVPTPYESGKIPSAPETTRSLDRAPGF